MTPHVRLGTRVTRIAYEDGAWTVDSADGHSRRARIVINALGVLVHPQTPDIPGLNEFQGARFHSARWDHSVPLDGQRIGIIGTGSSRASPALPAGSRTGRWKTRSAGPSSAINRCRK